jgi:hypothetical protein
MRYSRQLVATHGNSFGLFRRSSGLSICDRLPPVATTGSIKLHVSLSQLTTLRDSPRGRGADRIRAVGGARSEDTGECEVRVPVGCVWRTFRSARWSQVRMSSSPTRIRCKASLKVGAMSSTASGAPSQAWFGASAGALRLERTTPIGRTPYGSLLSIRVRVSHEPPSGFVGFRRSPGSGRPRSGALSVRV